MTAKAKKSKLSPLAIGNFGNAVICVILSVFCLICVAPLILV